MDTHCPGGGTNTTGNVSLHLIEGGAIRRVIGWGDAGLCAKKRLRARELGVIGGFTYSVRANELFEIRQTVKLNDASIIRLSK